jgi:polyisoprenoid-binding protein YceI
LRGRFIGPPWASFDFLVASLPVSPALAQGTVFKIIQEGSSVRFSVKASVAIAGKFDKWDATLSYPSTDAMSCVLDIKIQAASFDTGSVPC